jgi:hypothetical protein
MIAHERRMRGEGAVWWGYLSPGDFFLQKARQQVYLLDLCALVDKVDSSVFMTPSKRRE